MSTASPSQIARVLAEVERTGITIGWLADWYAYHFDRPLHDLDSQTAKALLTYLPHWPTRTQGMDGSGSLLRRSAPSE